MKKIKAYKAFNDDWTCDGFQYEVGKSYKISGKLEMCKKGFHACRNAADTLSRYPGACVFAEVELSGRIIEDGDKLCGSKIKILRRVSLAEALVASIGNVEDSHSATTGDYSHSATSGDYSHSATTGYKSRSATTGDNSHSATAGGNSHSATTGKYSHSATTGKYSHSGTTGYRSHSATTGNYSHSATTGKYSHSATTGYKSHSATTGDYSKSKVSGTNSSAVALGEDSQVMGIKGTPVALCHYVGGNPVKIVSGVIGKRGLKPDTWYTLDENGKFTEVN